MTARAIPQEAAGYSPRPAASVGIRPPRRHFAERPREDTEELLDRLSVTFGRLWSHDMSLEQLDRYAQLIRSAEKDALERVALKEEEIAPCLARPEPSTSSPSTSSASTTWTSNRRSSAG